MRGDINTKQDFARTESEAASDTTCFGFNILKVARLINLIVGIALAAVCGLKVFDLFSNLGTGFFSKLGLVQVNVFLG